MKLLKKELWEGPLKEAHAQVCEQVHWRVGALVHGPDVWRVRSQVNRLVIEQVEGELE